jgi:hypothetical protein
MASLASGLVQGLLKLKEVGLVAKRYGRPSLQYRYEHYDPFKG